MMVDTEQRRFNGRMIMQILDLYSEGKRPLPPADVIAARGAYLCESVGGGDDGSVELPN